MPRASLSLVSGDGQTAGQEEEVAEPIRVRYVDDDGDPSGQRIQVTVIRGGGQILNTSLETDVEGFLDIRWRLGRDIDQEIRITLPDGSVEPVTATATTLFRYREPLETNDGWPTAPLRIGAPGIALLEQTADAIRDGTWPEVHGRLIVRDDSLRFELYNPGHTSWGAFVDWGRNVPHEAQSATKSFRSTIVGIAIDRGFIDGVDMPLFDFFPAHDDLNTDGREEITLRDVLTMSAGLSWNETNAAQTNNLTQMYALPSATQWTEFVLSRPMQYDPGTTFVYSTGTSLLLDDIVENASGIPYADFVTEYYSDLVESAGPPGIGGTLGATVLPRDMAKLGHVFLRGGMWKDTRVVSEAWVEQAIQPRFQVNATVGYGYQWWSRSFFAAGRSWEAFYAAGNGGQFIFVVEDLDLVVVFTGGNFGSAVAEQTHTIMQQSIIPAVAQ